MKIRFTRYFDKKTKKGLGCKLPDGTVVLLRTGKQPGIWFGLEKKKWRKAWRKKPKSKYYDFIITLLEWEMIVKSLSKGRVRR